MKCPHCQKEMSSYQEDKEKGIISNIISIDVREYSWRCGTASNICLCFLFDKECRLLKTVTTGLENLILLALYG